MKYFETKHEKDSAKITLLMTLILLLMIFIMGIQYLDPPREYGVAVNFGTTDLGKGNAQPKKPIKSEPKKIEQLPQPESSKAVPTKSSEVNEDVLTQETEDAIAIKKQKEAEAKTKAIAEAKAGEKSAQDEKKKKLDALIGGISKSEGIETGSEGNDNRVGDKGQLDGNLYAHSFFGGAETGSDGIGYGLNGRGIASYEKLKQDCNESGMVIVKIVVNRNGDVIEAKPGVKGTTNTAKCLLDPAKKIALSHKWRPDSKAPAKQTGFVKVNFKLGQ